MSRTSRRLLAPAHAWAWPLPVRQKQHEGHCSGQHGLHALHSEQPASAVRPGTYTLEPTSSARAGQTWHGGAQRQAAPDLRAGLVRVRHGRVQRRALHQVDWWI